MSILLLYVFSREVAISLNGGKLISFGNAYSSAVDYAVKIRVNPQQTGIDTNVKHSMVRLYITQTTA